MNERVLLPVALTLALVLTVVCYWSGLNGPFLFDDAPNLKSLGEVGGVHDWITLKAYVLSGWSGPTGRPLSLLSFLIDDNTWPSNPAGFKVTSLKLHLMVGLMLVWATYLLLRATGRTEVQSAWVGLFSASMWMLHPFMLSTTLYVVQRMTVLSGLFMLFGMVGYLYGRRWISEPGRAQRHGYALMTISAGLGTLLAVLSKENGALLPMLLLTVELFLRRCSTGMAPHRIWVVLILGLPSIAVLVYLGNLVNFNPNLWPTRPFNQVERLYSESRIIWDYLRSLWIPRIEGSGLYQDGFKISRSLTDPISTLWAVMGLTALMLSLPLLYRRLPFVWLALTFYLVGHLTESTVVGLELIFEHRNYAPAFFMFLPVAVGLSRLSEDFGKRLAIIAGLAIIAMLAFLTWNRSQLWSSNERLQSYWAESSPESARGQNFLLANLVRSKQYSAALSAAEGAMNRIPQSALLTISWLQLNVSTKQATPQHFVTAAERLAAQPFDAQAVTGIRILTSDITRLPELAEYREPMLYFIQYLSEHGVYRRLPLFTRLIPYIEAQLYVSLGLREQALEKYQSAMERYRQASAAMQMFSEMANAGFLPEALHMLDVIEPAIHSGKYDSAPLGVEHYEGEILRLRGQLAQLSTLGADR